MKNQFFILEQVTYTDFRSEVLGRWTNGVATEHVVIYSLSEYVMNQRIVFWIEGAFLDLRMSWCIRFTKALGSEISTYLLQDAC